MCVCACAHIPFMFKNERKTPRHFLSGQPPTKNMSVPVTGTAKSACDGLSVTAVYQPHRPPPAAHHQPREGGREGGWARGPAQPAGASRPLPHPASSLRGLPGSHGNQAAAALSSAPAPGATTAPEGRRGQQPSRVRSGEPGKAGGPGRAQPRGLVCGAAWQVALLPAPLAGPGPGRPAA